MMRHAKAVILVAAVVAGVVPASVSAAGATEGAAAVPAAIPTGRAAKSWLIDIARAGKRLVAVGERGHVVVSDDEGRNWRQATVPTRVLLTAVHFPTATDGWAVGHDGTIIHSADGGATWTLQRRQPFDADAALKAEEDALAEAEAAGVDVESDAGAAIGAAAGSRVGAALLDLWFVDAQHGFVVGGNGTLLETDDGGATWNDRSRRLDNPDGWHITAIAAYAGNPKTLLLAGEKGTAFRSTDGGQTFRRIHPGSNDGSYFGVLTTGKDAYMFGLQGRLFRSGDGGNSWKALETGVTSGLNDGAVLADGTVVIAGNAGIVLTIAPGAARPVTVRRSDRKAETSAIGVDGGMVLVGESGVKVARPDGNSP